MQGRRVILGRRPLPFHVLWFAISAVLGPAQFGLVLDSAEVLVQDDEVWKFHRGSTAPSDPISGWRQPDFADDAWEEGQTGIGYGDTDDRTVLTDMQNAYAAIFCRKEFQVTDAAALQNLVLYMGYDDGFVAYLNGQEVARRNVGAVGEDFTFDQVASADHENAAVERIDITASLGALETGPNVLAVEVRNVNLPSSDLAFVPRLVGNDETLTCPIGLTCTLSGTSVILTWTNGGTVPYERIEITRNGAPLPGSPFAGDAVTATDADPGTTLDATYSLVAVQASGPCPPITCTSTLQSRGGGDMQCSLALVGGATQATVTWTNIPDTVRAEVRREGALVATLTAGEETYIDPDVESDMPEDDTNFEVRLFDQAGNTATMTCGADLSLCPTVACELVDVGGVDRVRLSIGNVVKEWTTFTVRREVGGVTVDLTTTLPGDSSEFVDDTYEPEEGVSATYTLSPVAPAGEQVGCDRSCSISLPTPEVGSYLPPAGGWDYSIDFEALAEVGYNSLTGEKGNLDGEWIRSIDRDFWDGSAPDEVGAPPEGPAPGGVELVARPSLGACGTDTRSLRMLDPGNPNMPAGTLLAAYPAPFDDPSNKAIFLGVDSLVADRNLLRTGVTFAARMRIDPAAPAYLGAQPTGDGEPLASAGSLGTVGFYFLNTGNIVPTEGPGAAASFALNSGDQLQFSSVPMATLAGAGVITYRSLWVTVVDPEGDGSYDVKVYTNGSTTPYAFGTGAAVALATPTFNFGSSSGNYLAIGLPDVGNDSVVEIDYVAWKDGVHAPTVSGCAPCANNPPTARVSVTPAGGQVQLSGGAAQVTLDGATSDSGDGAGQTLSYSWRKVSGPAGDTIAGPTDRSTVVGFTAPGSYVYRLTVDDGQSCQQSASAQTTITVLPPSTGGVTFRRGDSDASGNIDLSDAVSVLQHLFLGGTKPVCWEAADTDDNGIVDISDPISNLQYQFLGGPPPAAPGPSTCGEDVNQESPDLGCTQAC